jgi:cytochrome c553
VQPGASATVAGQALRATTSVVCTSCHQEGYKGEGTQPRLAGQRKQYLAQTMLDFRNGMRANNPGMSDLMKAISESDVAAIAEYVAGL